jgi:ribonucleotide reductase beta subunit family protein with ferritin-like domain
MSEDLVEFFESQIELENSIVKSVNDALEELDNEAVQMALRGISLDSSKHADMYRSGIAFLTKSTKPLNEEMMDRQRKVIERHIKLEEAVIEELEKKMPKIENQKLKLLMKAIMADEKRHHKLLTNLHEIIVKGETITEGDWYDAIWGDVPGLWT